MSMATGWAGAVIRCERIEGRVTAAGLEGSGAVLLRVQMSLGDAAPEVLGPLVARRSDAEQLIAAVLDRIFEALADPPPGDEADQNGHAPTSSDS
jgi:hypothetical protein